MPIYFDLSTHKLPISVESIGNRWNQERVQRPKGYLHYHWLQTEKGEGNIVIDGKSLHLTEGAGILIAPFVPHSYDTDQSEWRTSFVTFSGTMDAHIDTIIGQDRYIPVAAGSGASFQSWIDHAIDLHERQQTDPVQLSVDCYAFLMNVSRFQEYRDYMNQPLYLRYVVPIMKEIETRYFEDITSESLANTVFVSPQYLTRLFKRFLGCSTYQYLTNYRMMKAKEILVNRPDLAISQISYRVGYHDTSHFITMFKSATGCTPLEFRHLHH